MLSRRLSSAAALLSVLLLGILCGCTAAPTADPGTASLGAVPIPTAPAVDPMPTATIGKPQLLAMGASTLVVFDPATRGTATATGHDQRITQPATSGTASLPGTRTSATITLTVKSARGSIPPPSLTWSVAIKRAPSSLLRRSVRRARLRLRKSPHNWWFGALSQAVQPR